ncbi:protein of unknown function (plasmid) [Cupriavidus taiwanensis]|nr:protein of unknown function [Cupriavidus taiwanensis]
MPPCCRLDGKEAAGYASETATPAKHDTSCNLPHTLKQHRFIAPKKRCQACGGSLAITGKLAGSLRQQDPL